MRLLPSPSSCVFCFCPSSLDIAYRVESRVWAGEPLLGMQLLSLINEASEMKALMGLT